MSDIQFTKTNKPTIKLWNPKVFLVFELFFSFLPVGILSALNYGRSGDEKKKWAAILATISGVILLIVLLILLPFNKFIYIGYGISLSIGTYFYYTQQKLYDQYVQNGGESASYLLPAILSIAAVILLALYISFAEFIISDITKTIKYGKSTIHFTNNVSVPDASLIGGVVDKDIFSRDFEDSGTEAKLDKENHTLILSIKVTPEQLNDPSFCSSIQSDCDLISIKFLSENHKDHNIKINLCDSDFKTLKSIHSD